MQVTGCPGSYLLTALHQMLTLLHPFFVKTVDFVVSVFWHDICSMIAHRDKIAKKDLCMGRSQDKVVIVTASGSGLRRAITIGYAKEGAKVCTVKWVVDMMTV
jgi:hypothetical protein